MKNFLLGICIILLILHQEVFAQDKVLVYYETNGFRHKSIDEGIDMIKALGKSNGLWTTDTSDKSSVFNKKNLTKYNAVIWCNTSGNGLLNDKERAAFEAYIQNGGGFVGIHAATDTYRDGSWPFYNELVGAIIRTNPNHTKNNYKGTMKVNVPNHQTVAFLEGKTWDKKEEYYYWKGNGGKLYDSNQVVLTVGKTGDNSYDESRPISWYKEFMGGRSFYTALGHNEGDYKNDTKFRRHIEEAIKWTGDFSKTTPIPEEQEVQLLENGSYLVKNPELNEVLTSSMQSGNNAAMEVYTGEAVQRWDFTHLGTNIYTIRNVDTNRYLEIPEAECTTGANIATWTSANSNHQKFKLSKVDGVYFLRPQHCLQTAVDRSRGAAGANVQLWTYDEGANKNKNQKWEILSANTTLTVPGFTKEVQNIAVFPNPVKTFFSIAGLIQETDVQIVDLSGKVVLQQRVNSVNGIVNISSLHEGIYFLKSIDKSFKTQRLIKL